MKRRVHTALLCLFLGTSIQSYGVLAHSGNQQFNFDDYSQVDPEFGPQPPTKFEESEAKSKELEETLKKRAEKKEAFGSSLEDLKTHLEINKSQEDFFKNLESLGIKEDYKAHFEVIKDLEKKYKEISNEDPQKEDKRKEVLKSLKEKYDGLRTIIELAEKKNSESGSPKSAEDFIKAKEFVDRIAQMKKQMLVMNDGKAASKDPFRTLVGNGGQFIAGDLGKIGAEAAYDLVTGISKPGNNIDPNYELPKQDNNVKPPPKENDSVAETKPENKPEQKPDSKPIENKATPPNEEKKTEDKLTTGDTEKPVHTADQSATPAQETTPSATGSEPDDFSDDFSEPESKKPSSNPLTGNFYQAPTVSKGAKTDFESGSHAGKGVTINSAPQTKTTEIKRQTIVKEEIKPNIPPVKFNPDSPVRPSYTQTATTFPTTTIANTQATQTGPLTPPAQFFAPPSDLPTPVVKGLSDVNAPANLGIPGVESPRLGGGTSTIGDGDSGNPVRIVGRNPASIPSATKADYDKAANLVKNTDPTFYKTGETVTNFETAKARGILADPKKQEDPYVYSPGQIKEPSKLEAPVMVVGNTTVFTDKPDSGPTNEAIKNASGIKVGSIALPPKTNVDNSSILQIARGFAHITGTALTPILGKKSGEIQAFMKMMVQRQPNGQVSSQQSINQIAAAISVLNRR